MTATAVRRPEEDHVHLWFGLTYASYLTLPRSVLQSMPDEWQERFVAMLRELDEAYGHLDWPAYRVSAVDRSTGKFIRDPIPPYCRGRTYIPPAGPAGQATPQITGSRPEDRRRDRGSLAELARPDRARLRQR
jgi:hypothetical protein